MSTTPMRQAAPAELDDVVDVFAHAFATDPVWGVWTFPHASAAERVPLLREFWRPFVVAATKFDGLLVLDDLAAVSLWVPPGLAELDADDEAAVEEMAHRVCSGRIDLQVAGWEAFEAARPEEPHWYLSLLGTAPARRGSGLGMRLVEAQLARVDDEGRAAYLESTNPGNLERYRRAGFELFRSFDMPEGPRVDQMWREPR